MRFYWVRDRFKQQHSDMFWKLGVSNLGDYFTKHHSPAHQKVMVPVYLHCTNSGQASASVCYSKCTSNKNQANLCLHESIKTQKTNP